MPLELVLPRLGEKDKTTKDLVIDILSREWPLTAKKIYNRVKSYGIDVTYQAVHKTIRHLLGQEVLVKTAMGYKLNEEWIRDIHNFSEKLRKSYTKQEVVQDTKFPQTTTFGTQIDMGKFILDLLEKNFLGGYKEIFCNWSFIWTPLPFSKREYGQLKSIMKRKNGYIVTKDNRFYSRWHADIWRKIGAKVMINVKNALEMDYLVYGPYIIQVYWGSVIKDAQKAYLNRFKTAKDIDINVMYEDIINRKGEISVVILKDKKLAEKLGREILKYFGK